MGWFLIVYCGLLLFAFCSGAIDRCRALNWEALLVRNEIVGFSVCDRRWDIWCEWGTGESEGFRGLEIIDTCILRGLTFYIVNFM